jgi:hypothetical protein
MGSASPSARSRSAASAMRASSISGRTTRARRARAAGEGRFQNVRPVPHHRQETADMTDTVKINRGLKGIYFERSGVSDIDGRAGTLTTAAIRSTIWRRNRRSRRSPIC